jgi:N-methylhydantoinase B
MSDKPAGDPILNEIIRNALTMVAEEAGISAARSASSVMANTSSSIACAVFDKDARLVAQTLGGLIHVSALRCMLPEVLKDHPPETLREGDAIAVNDQFRGGIHPTDVGMFRPIFHNGEPVFYCGVLMIVSDLGGMSSGGLPANATEVFHEGMVIPPVKYFDQGQRRADIAAFIRSNSRTPHKIIGDIDALVIGGNIAAARMAELIEKHGYARLVEVIDDLMAYSERLLRHGIAEIPDGVYRGRYDVEDDGVEFDRPFTVQVAITVKGSDCHMDFTGTSPQARGPINASYSQSLSGAVYALLCHVNPDVPVNEGFYRTIETTFPLGSLVNAKYPAACNLRMAVVHAMLDAVNIAFAEAFPERGVAASGVPSTIQANGKQLNSDTPWSFLDVALGIGGARYGADGVDGAAHVIYGFATYGVGVEASEWEYPIRYRCFRLAQDSAGPGKWRGGAGLHKEIEFLTEAMLTVRGTDRYRNPPRGVAGGLPAGASAWILNKGRPDEQQLPAKKTNHLVRAGDTLALTMAGGGGYGDPKTRDPAEVMRDVKAGLVSRESAVRDYGLDPARLGECDA